MDNSVAFNGTRDIFAIGTSDGIEIWNAVVPKATVRYSRAVPGGVHLAAALGATNLAMIVTPTIGAGC